MLSSIEINMVDMTKCEFIKNENGSQVAFISVSVSGLLALMHVARKFLTLLIWLVKIC